WDTFVAVAAGPLSNILQATIYGIFMRIALKNGLISFNDIVAASDRTGGSFLGALLFFGVMINLSLAIFNLIPFGILDGHWLVGQLLPEKQQYYWYKFNRSYGWKILVGIILFEQISKIPILDYFIVPPLLYLFHLLTGIG